MKKDVVPSGSSMTPEEDARFEERTAADIKRHPPGTWSLQLGRWLAAAHPSTRSRLLMMMLTKCADHATSPPRQLVDAIGRELGVSESPRARVHDPAKVKEAARFKAHNKGASIRQIAFAVGIRSHATVFNFTQMEAFKKHLDDELFLIEHERKRLDGIEASRLRSLKKEMLNGK
jgi:hypothetical protein